MRAPKPLQGALLAGLAVTLISAPAHADRRTSLAGNQLIKDRDDSFVYPQAMLEYNNTLSLDYGAAETDGNALLIAGPNKKSALGVALHRGDVTMPLGGLSYLVKDLERGVLGGAPSLSPDAEVFGTAASIADLMYAMRLGKNSLGFRLGLTSVGDISTPDKGKDSGRAGFGVRVSAGYSMGKRGDFVFDFSNTSGSQVQENKNVREFSVLGAHLGGRFRVSQNQAKTFKLVALADFNFASTSDTDLVAPGDPAVTNQVFSLMAGFGPAYSTKDKKLKVAFHATAGFVSNSSDPNTEVKEDGDSRALVVFPGFNVALEYAIRDWLYFRSGAISAFSLLSTSAERGDARSQNGLSPLFGWNAGLGVALERFKLDATLNHGFITNGPAILSGAQTAGMLALVSATVAFGDAGRAPRAEGEQPAGAQPKKD